MMTLVVVSELDDWPKIPSGCEVTTAREYLTSASYLERPRLRVINLCRSHRYQKAGYYVSLMATARGHKPLPSIGTIQELKSTTIARLVGDELSDLIDERLANAKSPTNRIELDIYFGLDPSGRYPRIASALYKRFPAPLLRALFITNERRAGKWYLASVSLGRLDQLTPEQRAAFAQAAEDFFSRRPKAARKRSPSAYDLAILIDPDEKEPPSNALALKKFVRAAEQVGLAAELIDKHDFGSLPQYDALFIRETTAVNHRTYRFAQRAAAEGMVVIDDPESILRCTNKVFLAEMLTRYDIPAPPTAVVHRGNVKEVLERLGTPCILKQPDSSFSQGVVKANDPIEYDQKLTSLLKRSELVIAQGFMPTPFDWRVGVLNRRPLYACRYFMAARHWQVIKRGNAPGEKAEGPSEAVALHKVPPAILEQAVRAANLMGDGLYGVDLKELGGRPYVIEVNDNPSIDAGYEDELLGDELYLAIMTEFRRRLDVQRGLKPPIT